MEESTSQLQKNYNRRYQGMKHLNYRILKSLLLFKETYSSLLQLKSTSGISHLERGQRRWMGKFLTMEVMLSHLHTLGPDRIARPNI